MFSGSGGCPHSAGKWDVAQTAGHFVFPALPDWEVYWHLHQSPAPGSKSTSGRSNVGQLTTASQTGGVVHPVGAYIRYPHMDIRIVGGAKFYLHCDHLAPPFTQIEGWSPTAAARWSNPLATQLMGHAPMRPSRRETRLHR